MWILIFGACSRQEDSDTDAVDTQVGDTDTDADSDTDSDTDTDTDTDSDTVPASIRASGTAISQGFGVPPKTASCSWWFTADELVPTADGWTGTITAGEVDRISHDVNAGSEFQALIAGEVTLTTTDAGVQLRFVGDQPDTALPFWLALEVVQGTSDAAWTAAGTWSCAPTGLVDGYYTDDSPTVDGTWSLAPE
jgi:hypothetical protein